MPTLPPHDEDGDGIVDECDNCPAIANPLQSDVIETSAHAFPDGVGDDCDPRQRLGGDVLRAFYSFQDPAQADAWTGSGFSIAGDALHGDGDAMWAAKDTLQGDGLYVLAQLAPVSFGATGELSITLDGDGVGFGSTCVLSAQQLVAREIVGDTMAVDLAGAIDFTQPASFVAWRVGYLAPTGRIAQLRCRITQGSVTKDAMLALPDVASGEQVIAVRDLSIEIESVSVYTSPGPKNP